MERRSGLHTNVAEAGNTGMTQQQVNPAPQANPIVDLNSLLELGFIEDQITVQGLTFKMHTLRGEENNELIKGIKGIENDMTMAVDLRIATIASAVTHVNNIPMEDLYTRPDAMQKTATEKRKWIIAQLQQSVINLLFDHYTEISKRSDGAVKELGK